MDLEAAYRCQDDAIGLWNDRVRRLESRLDPRAAQREVWRAAAGRPDLRARTAACQRCRDHRSRRCSRAASPPSKQSSCSSSRRMLPQMSATGPRKPRVASSRRCSWASRSPAARCRTSMISDPRWSPATSATTPDLLVGPEIADWQLRAPGLPALRVTHRGRGGRPRHAASVDGGPLSALAFALSCNCASRPAIACRRLRHHRCGHRRARNRRRAIGRSALQRRRNPALRDRAHDTGCIARTGTGDNRRAAARFRTIPFP